MEIHELTERQSTLDTGVYLPVDDGDVTQKIDYPRLAQAIIEQYTASSLGGSYRSIKTALDAIKTTVDGKVNTSDVVNNLVTTAEGKVLDARQGKTLNDSISTINTNMIPLMGTQSNAISNVDANDYITTGLYQVGSPATVSNLPSGVGYGQLIVTKTRSYIRQEYYESNGTIVYSRFSTNIGSSWSNWTEIINSAKTPKIIFSGQLSSTSRTFTIINNHIYVLVAEHPYNSAALALISGWSSGGNYRVVWIKENTGITASVSGTTLTVTVNNANWVRLIDLQEGL